MINMDLCRPCMEELKKDGRACALVHRGVNEKITCAVCGRRSYGATYSVTKGVKK